MLLDFSVAVFEDPLALCLGDDVLRYQRGLVVDARFDVEELGAVMSVLDISEELGILC